MDVYNGTFQSRGKIMSDHFYAVQFRSIHSAKHSIVMFSLESKAIQLLAILKVAEQFPDESEMKMEPGNYVETIDIDFRNPPREYEGVPLLYVNNPENSIPDVYNF